MKQLKVERQETRDKRQETFSLVSCPLSLVEVSL